MKMMSGNNVFHKCEKMSSVVWCVDQQLAAPLIDAAPTQHCKIKHKHEAAVAAAALPSFYFFVVMSTKQQHKIDSW